MVSGRSKCRIYSFIQAADRRDPVLWVHGGILILVVHHVTCQSAPAHCSFLNDNLFYCDYPSMNTTYRPIDYSGFSPTPQRLKVRVHGFVPNTADTQVFSTSFSGINKNSFDNNYASSMELICDRKGFIYFRDDTFANMSHTQRLKIKDCEISYISANAFEELEYLDYFGIEMGSIVSMSVLGMFGLSVEKLTTDTHTIPQNLGKFEMLYSALPSNTIPAGFLANWKNLTSATIKGCSVSSLPSYTFLYNTQLRYIDLSDNTFQTLPSGMMDEMPSLTELRAYNIEWNCSCGNLWFVPDLVASNVTLFGDNYCNGESRNIFKYYYDTCVTPSVCGDMTGFAMGAQCVGPFSVIIMILAIGALAADIVALVLVILILVAMKGSEQREQAARGRWNELIERLIISKKKGNMPTNNNIGPPPVENTKMAFA